MTRGVDLAIPLNHRLRFSLTQFPSNSRCFPMASTTRTTPQPAAEDQAPLLRWRCWPLMDHPRWSWLVAVAILAVGILVWFLGGGWLLAAAAMTGLAATLWQFLLPVDYEISTLGLRRRALRRARLVPWHTVRAYQPRTSGIVLYQRSDPTKLDLLRSVFVPYPADEDELLCAARQHLSHAVELPP